MGRRVRPLTSSLSKTSLGSTSGWSALRSVDLAERRLQAAVDRPDAVGNRLKYGAHTLHHWDEGDLDFWDASDAPAELADFAPSSRPRLASDRGSAFCQLPRSRSGCPYPVDNHGFRSCLHLAISDKLLIGSPSQGP
jgi:hypothetical protein